MNIRDAIEGIRNLRNDLQRTEYFLDSHETKWMDNLREIAMETALDLKPENWGPVEWDAFTQQLIDHLIVEDKSAIRMVYGLTFAPESITLSAKEIGIEQVTSWVQAGLEGDPLGKNVLQYEYWDNASISRIANSILYLINGGSESSSPTPDTEWSTLREFVSTGAQANSESILPQIYEEWARQMPGIICRDWRIWIDQAVENAFPV